MSSHLKALQYNITHQEADGFLVSQPENLRYLCGYTGSGWLLVTSNDAWLCADSIYISQARSEMEGTNLPVLSITGDIGDSLLKTAASHGISILGFEPSALSFASYQALNNSAQKEKIRLIPIKEMVEPLRLIKDLSEQAIITKAASMADSIFEFMVSIIKPGMSESQVAWEMEKYSRENGGDAIPFEFIVASGPNSAMPHARPTDRIIKQGEPIMVDIGARTSGYCSDLSRTICLGKFDETFRKIYDIVLSAQLNAIESIKPGFNGREADATARLVIEEAGYGKQFAHGLGHGVGLMVHEAPRLSPLSVDILGDGMVFTIEPGIYVEGWGGIRIEDTVILHSGKIKSLTGANKVRNLFQEGPIS